MVSVIRVRRTAIACPVGHLVTTDRDWPAKLAPIQGRVGVVILSDVLARA